MKHLKTPQQLNEASENLNISDVSDSSYREFLIQVSNDRKVLENKRRELLSSDDRIKGLKMLPQIQSIIQLQDKLINYVSVIEKKNIQEIRDEFDFTY
jgi:hypothetical protein